MTSSSPCDCCGRPEQCQRFQVFMSHPLQHLCALMLLPSLENASGSCTSFKLTQPPLGNLPQSFGLSSDLEVAPLPWASKAPCFCFI